MSDRNLLTEGYSCEPNPSAPHSWFVIKPHSDVVYTCCPVTWTCDCTAGKRGMSCAHLIDLPRLVQKAIEIKRGFIGDPDFADLSDSLAADADYFAKAWSETLRAVRSEKKARIRPATLYAQIHIAA